MKRSQTSKKTGASGSKPGSSSKSGTSGRSSGKTNQSGNSNSNNGKSSNLNVESNKDHSETQLHELFLDMLKDTYWAEQHLVEGLQKLCDAASTDVLQSAFEDHKFVTQKHVSRLEKVFSLLGEEP